MCYARLFHCIRGILTLPWTQNQKGGGGGGSLPQPEIKVRLEILFNLRSTVVCLIQSFTEKPVFECPFAHPMILILSYLVENSIYRVSVICKLAMEWYEERPTYLTVTANCTNYIV